jgi:DNA-binding response OmpR family regulator
MKKRILVVEDDAGLARVLRDTLSFEGFEVEWEATGREALNRVRAFAPDLVVLDVTLPDTTGFDLCGVLRQGGHTPIIILSARSQKADKLRGLDLGADDYITKPFDLEEFLARVRALLRRTRPTVDVLVLGDISIDFRARDATRAGRAFRLTHREFELLHYLAERRDHAVYRNELLREIWGYPDYAATRSVDHAIARLRKKIEPDAHRPRFIHTVHGDGYCLTPSGVSEPAPRSD